MYIKINLTISTNYPIANSLSKYHNAVKTNMCKPCNDKTKFVRMFVSILSRNVKLKVTFMQKSNEL